MEVSGYAALTIVGNGAKQHFALDDFVAGIDQNFTTEHLSVDRRNAFNENCLLVYRELAQGQPQKPSATPYMKGVALGL